MIIRNPKEDQARKGAHEEKIWFYVQPENAIP